MPLITPLLISLLVILPMGFFNFVLETKQDFIDIGLFFLWLD